MAAKKVTINFLSDRLLESKVNAVRLGRSDFAESASKSEKDKRRWAFIVDDSEYRLFNIARTFKTANLLLDENIENENAKVESNTEFLNECLEASVSKDLEAIRAKGGKVEVTQIQNESQYLRDAVRRSVLSIIASGMIGETEKKTKKFVQAHLEKIAKEKSDAIHHGLKNWASSSDAV